MAKEEKLEAFSNIKKRREKIRSITKETSRAEAALKCYCMHTNSNGDLNLVATNRRREMPDGTSRTIYVCRACEKEVCLDAIPEVELEKACGVIDRTIDLLKITADPKSEKDMEIIRKMSKVQDRVVNQLPAYYQAAREASRRGKKRRPRNESSISFDRPSSRG